MGSYYLRAWHMRWFKDNLSDGVSVRDISDDWVGFSLSGPRSRELLETVVQNADVSHQGFRFLACREIDVGMTRAKVGRLSVNGELGYEINVPASEHLTLYRTLKKAGSDFGMVEIGFNAMLSLRIEKSFGLWNREFTQAYTPGETGMDRWINFDKKDFIGRDAALKEREKGARRQLVTLEVAADDADTSSWEPVWRGNKMVGYITSGAYGHTIGKSIGMALVERAHAAVGTELTTHVVGIERKAKVVAPSPYDPTGSRMRI